MEFKYELIKVRNIFVSELGIIIHNNTKMQELN